MGNSLINIPEKIELPGCIDNAIEKATDKPAQTIGTIVSDLFNLSFGWVSYLSEKQRIKYSHGLEKLKKSLEEKASAIPDERRIEPDLQVAGQALENVKYCLDKEELREMFANLIASSMDLSKYNKAIPLFSMIIKQLTPYDTKILSTFAGVYNNVNPICRYNAKNNSGSVTLQTNVYLEGITEANVSEIEKRAASISSLCVLGLVETNYSEFLVTKNLYDQFDKIEAYYDYVRKAESLSGNRKIDINKGLVILTPIGKQFMEICMPEQT